MVDTEKERLETTRSGVTTSTNTSSLVDGAEIVRENGDERENEIGDEREIVSERENESESGGESENGGGKKRHSNHMLKSHLRQLHAFSKNDDKNGTDNVNGSPHSMFLLNIPSGFNSPLSKVTSGGSNRQFSFSAFHHHNTTTTNNSNNNNSSSGRSSSSSSSSSTSSSRNNDDGSGNTAHSSGSSQSKTDVSKKYVGKTRSNSLSLQSGRNINYDDDDDDDNNDNIEEGNVKNSYLHNKKKFFSLKRLASTSSMSDLLDTHSNKKDNKNDNKKDNKNDGSKFNKSTNVRMHSLDSSGSNSGLHDLSPTSSNVTKRSVPINFLNVVSEPIGSAPINHQQKSSTPSVSKGMDSKKKDFTIKRSSSMQHLGVGGAGHFNSNSGSQKNGNDNDNDLNAGNSSLLSSSFFKKKPKVSAMSMVHLDSNLDNLDDITSLKQPSFFMTGETSKENNNPMSNDNIHNTNTNTDAQKHPQLNDNIWRSPSLKSIGSTKDGSVSYDPLNASNIQLQTSWKAPESWDIYSADDGSDPSSNNSGILTIDNTNPQGLEQKLKPENDAPLQNVEKLPNNFIIGNNNEDKRKGHYATLREPLHTPQRVNPLLRSEIEINKSGSPASYASKHALSTLLKNDDDDDDDNDNDDEKRDDHLSLSSRAPSFEEGTLVEKNSSSQAHLGAKQNYKESLTSRGSSGSNIGPIPMITDEEFKEKILKTDTQGTDDKRLSTPEKQSLNFSENSFSDLNLTSPRTEYDDEFGSEIIIRKSIVDSAIPDADFGSPEIKINDEKLEPYTPERAKGRKAPVSYASSTSSSNAPLKPLKQRAIEVFGGKSDSEGKISDSERYYNDFSDVDLQKRFAIRVFNQNDGTFTTLSCTIGTTVREMIPLIKRKFNVTSSGVYQMSLKIGKLSKVLHTHSKPISIQLRLLLLSGYRKHHDPLHILGIEDLSFVFQFFFHPIMSSQLSHERESLLLKNKSFVRADLRDMDLTKPPIVFYQQARHLESMDVSNNANITLPLDFIESANNLSSIRMSSIRASKFPQNVCEVRTLVSLDLSKNFIKKIPQELSQLENLTILNLKCNKLEKLPQGFGALKNLQWLDLASNQFVFFPEVVTKCTSLLQIDFSNNKIQSIPASINNLKKLVKINLSNNRLKKIGDLSGMSSLRTLTARYNQITAVETYSESLQIIAVTGNRIFDFSDKLPNLRTLEMHKNPLTSLFGSNACLSNLTVLCLNKASLTIFPTVIWQQLLQLKRLELNENNLTQLPHSIGDLTKLAQLSANKNKLASIPGSLVKLKNLTELDLHSNNITELCPDFGELTLRKLNLSSNMLHSRQNNLVSSITLEQDLCDLPISKTLRILSIADNRLNNSSWTWLNLFKKLVYLNISYNMFTELESTGRAQFTELAELYISGNMITALSGDFISTNLKNLRILMANDNRLQTLPAEISSLNNLTVLDIGDNQLKYNISNYQYDWNWINNKRLKYLNFSGNKRFEIVSSSNGEHDYSDLTQFPELTILGLMDVTLKTLKVPDETFNLRLRTIESNVNGMGYGVADTLGNKDFVTSRDFTADKFRGKMDESLICLFDGKNEISNTINRIPKVVRDLYGGIFARMLDKYGDGNDTSIKSALRHSFLQLNKELNAMANSSTANEFLSDHLDARDIEEMKITPIDLSSGSTATVVYIKGDKIYTANIGDTMAVLTRNTGDHIVLTKNHSPNELAEYIRIRIAGGYVTNDRVDDVSDVSRAVGFFHLLPHIHASPDIKVFSISQSDEMLIMATQKLWEYIDYETASDIARENKLQPMVAAAKLKDYAIAYGCNDTLTVICFSLDKNHIGNNQPQFTINRDDLMNMRKNAFEDSTLRRLQPEIQPPTGNVAIVFTDIKNSTYLWELHQNAMRSAIKTHNSIMRRQLRIFGGYEVKTEGDAFMVAFPTPISALNWCLSVQLKLLEADWPEEILSTPDGCLISDENKNTLFYGLSVRMGIHWGRASSEVDVVTLRMDYMGPMVNKASRVSGIADGGQITLSADFITEFNNIMSLHQRTKTGTETWKDIYGDDLLAEIVEREIQILDEIGFVFKELGQVKLKGLESMELITLVYPKVLEERYYMAQQNGPGGLTTEETLFYLRQISLKLEYVLSCINGGVYYTGNNPATRQLSQFSKETKSSIFAKKNDESVMDFFDHLVTRIEMMIVGLTMRQRAVGNLDCANNTINDSTKSLFEIMDELFKVIPKGKSNPT